MTIDHFQVNFTIVLTKIYFCRTSLKYISINNEYKANNILIADQFLQALSCVLQISSHIQSHNQLFSRATEHTYPLGISCNWKSSRDKSFDLFNFLLIIFWGTSSFTIKTNLAWPKFEVFIFEDISKSVKISNFCLLKISGYMVGKQPHNCYNRDNLIDNQYYTYFVVMMIRNQ